MAYQATMVTFMLASTRSLFLNGYLDLWLWGQVHPSVKYHSDQTRQQSGVSRER